MLKGANIISYALLYVGHTPHRIVAEVGITFVISVCVIFQTAIRRAKFSG